MTRGGPGSTPDGGPAARRICLIGGARYGRPLDESTARKFETLAPLGRFWVIGFTDALRPYMHRERGTTFYLLPGRWWPVARYAALFVLGTLLCAWCVVVHGVRILVAQSPYEAVPPAVVKRLARLLGQRLVLIVESHGNFEASLFLQRAVRAPRLYHWMMRVAATYGAGAADLLRAVSRTTADQLREAAGPKPLVVFHTWTDLDVFFAAGTVRRPGTAVVYAGVLTPLKGIDLLVDAVAEIPGDVDLFIIGRPVNASYAADLRRRVNTAGLAPRVHFLGHVTQDELAARLATARAFVLPSFSEGLPRVILEAMAVGVPVVATPVSGIPEVVEDGVTGWLIPPGDAHALADRLRWLVARPAEAEAMGAAGRAAALARFSIAAYRRGYGDLFALADDILRPDGQRKATPIQTGHRQE